MPQQNSSKHDEAFPCKLYQIECDKINTLITPRGLKKSYVRLSKDFDALDVANRVGVI